MNIYPYTQDTIVCYCSKISVGEIRRAVENGCNDILEVRNFLGKHITGKCKTASPYKKCCHGFFNQIIADKKAAT